jgi:hypothetical protein
MNEDLLITLKHQITEARLELEQGGKHNWNDALSDCDKWLEAALKLLKNNIKED